MMRSLTNCINKFKLAQIMGKVWICFFVSFSFLFLSGAQIEIESNVPSSDPIFVSKDAVFFVSKEASVFTEKNGTVQKITKKFLDDSVTTEVQKEFKKNQISKIKTQEVVKNSKSESVPIKVFYSWKEIPVSDAFSAIGKSCTYCVLGSSVLITFTLHSNYESKSIDFYYSDTHFTNYTRVLLKQDYLNWIQSRPPPLEKFI